MAGKMTVELSRDQIQSRLTLNVLGIDEQIALMRQLRPGFLGGIPNPTQAFLSPETMSAVVAQYSQIRKPRILKQITDLRCSLIGAYVVREAPKVSLIGRAVDTLILVTELGIPTPPMGLASIHLNDGDGTDKERWLFIQPRVNTLDDIMKSKGAMLKRDVPQFCDKQGFPTIRVNIALSALENLCSRSGKTELLESLLLSNSPLRKFVSMKTIFKGYKDPINRQEMKRVFSICELQDADFSSHVTTNTKLSAMLAGINGIRNVLWTFGLEDVFVEPSSIEKGQREGYIVKKLGVHDTGIEEVLPLFKGCFAYGAARKGIPERVLAGQYVRKMIIENAELVVTLLSKGLIIDDLP